MIIFYARCSTAEQNEARQLGDAHACHAEKIYIDKASGKNRDRPQLEAMISFAREGDKVICSDISRIARNTRDLLTIIDELQKKGVAFQSLKESIDTSTPQGQFMLTVFGALAQLERDCIRQRTEEGRRIAMQEGRITGRPKVQVDKKQFLQVCVKWRAHENYSRRGTKTYRTYKQHVLSACKRNENLIITCYRNDFMIVLK